MANLGTKHECYSCGTKFYDLGKPEALCPKCGANQKDARKHDIAAAEAAAVRRKKREEVVAVPEVEHEDLLPSADEEFADEELVTPEGVDEENGGDEADDLDED
jgi:uncharacterized protein (TIGR02300 family)